MMMSIKSIEKKKYSRHAAEKQQQSTDSMITYGKTKKKKKESFSEKFKS